MPGSRSRRVGGVGVAGVGVGTRYARGFWVVVLAAAVVVSLGTVAHADPAGPTNYRSSVESITFTDGGTSDGAIPEPVPVDIEVVGGDAYLVLRSLGRSVLVPGYEGELYVRFEPDGRVFVNDRSPARWLNDARFGAADVEVPAAASTDAEPSWRLVATGGEWSWHDHRIHFMSPGLPPQVDPSRSVTQPVLEWTIPFEVDGRPAQASGTLTWVPGPGSVVPIGLLVLALGGAAVLARGGPGVLDGVVMAVGVVTFAVGAAARWSMPTGADVEPALLVLPGVGLAVLLGARLWRRQGGSRARIVSMGAGIPIGIWGVAQIGALTRPIVPGPLPTPVVAIVTAAALAVGLAALIGLGRTAVTATRVHVD